MFDDNLTYFQARSKMHETIDCAKVTLNRDWEWNNVVDINAEVRSGGFKVLSKCQLSKFTN